MGPSSNPELYENHAAPRVEALDEEFSRRMLLSSRLADLSSLFSDKDNTSHPVTESTLSIRLFALSHLQHTQMSIAGFSGMEAIDFSRGYSSIMAKVAPHHDEFQINENGNEGEVAAKTYRTRVIKITMPDDRLIGASNQHIEVFGLNFYQPEPKSTSMPTTDDGTKDPAAASYLTLIGRSGRAERKQEPITGETVVLAVRNTETNDAKLYAVCIIPPEEREVTGFDTKQVIHKSADEALVTLPDQTQISVKALSGQELLQAVDEFSAAIDVLKAIDSVDGDLSDTERAAVTASLATASSSNS